jgi:hypothetical protein
LRIFSPLGREILQVIAEGILSLKFHPLLCISKRPLKLTKPIMEKLNIHDKVGLIRHPGPDSQTQAHMQNQKSSFPRKDQFITF